MNYMNKFKIIKTSHKFYILFIQNSNFISCNIIKLIQPKTNYISPPLTIFFTFDGASESKLMIRRIYEEILSIEIINFIFYPLFKEKTTKRVQLYFFPPKYTHV